VNTGAAIVVSAVMVAAIYAWRWFTGGETPSAGANPQSIVGIGPLVSPEGFLVAWGVVYLIISLIAGFSEPLASSLAISVLVGDILANGVAVAQGTTKLRESKTQKSTGKEKVKSAQHR
jgi:hypothetical protein